MNPELQLAIAAACMGRGLSAEEAQEVWGVLEDQSTLIASTFDAYMVLDAAITSVIEKRPHAALNDREREIAALLRVAKRQIDVGGTAERYANSLYFAAQEMWDQLHR